MPDTAPQPPITTADALRIAHAAGFRGPTLVMAVAIAIAESGLRPNARNGNVDGSIDRGILQINSRWHSEVTDACADSPPCAFKAGFVISQNGTAFDPWSTYQEGAPLGHLDAVWSVALQLGLLSMPHLDRPFALPAGVTDYGSLVTQGFRNNNPAHEPAGWLSPDNWIGYVQQAGALAGNWHNGVDYGIVYGTPLHAPADGEIQLAGISGSGFGLRLVVAHQGVATLYGHLSAIIGRPGDRVTRGQLIAHSGGAPQYAGDQRPGNSLGAHLHWSVLDPTLARYLDPWPYLIPTASPLPPPSKPTSPVHMAPFTVTAATDGYPIHVFDGPATTLARVDEILVGTQIACDAWMAGEPRWDRGAKRLKSTWVHRAKGGWIAGARVIGNAPPNTP